MPLSKYRYIAVDGPIGAGKTSLARKLAERLAGEPLFERPGENPFLPRFYEDMERYALPTQLFFLFQRVAQLRELAQPGLFGGITVADFLLEKDPLFAQLTLSGDELSLYQRIYDAL
jgi:deoxyadenosine/deoxycytidine kinase